jgi:hypothetical protein
MILIVVSQVGDHGFGNHSSTPQFVSRLCPVKLCTLLER